MTRFNDAQQAELSSLIGRPIPGPYLELMANYPAELNRPYPGVPELISEFELAADPQAVIRLNQMVREEDIWTEEGPWPTHLLVIGEEIGGDLAALNLDEPGFPVERLLHEVAKFKRVAANLTDYIKLLNAIGAH